MVRHSTLPMIAYNVNKQSRVVGSRRKVRGAKRYEVGEVGSCFSADEFKGRPGS